MFNVSSKSLSWVRDGIICFATWICGVGFISRFQVVRCLALYFSAQSLGCLGRNLPWSGDWRDDSNASLLIGRSFSNSWQLLPFGDKDDGTHLWLDKSNQKISILNAYRQMELLTDFAGVEDWVLQQKFLLYGCSIWKTTTSVANSLQIYAIKWR